MELCRLALLCVTLKKNYIFNLCNEKALRTNVAVSVLMTTIMEKPHKY